MKRFTKLFVELTILVILLQTVVFTSTVAVTITEGSVSITPSVFSPDGNGLNDTVSISFDSTDQGPLYLNIFYNTTQIVRSDLLMTKTGDTFRATWNGKNDAGNYVSNDGLYTIRVSDTLGSGSGTAVGTVTVDTVGPTNPTLSIDGGKTYATSRNVTLTISASGATKMKISNYANFSDATWETYATTKSWQLLPSDGTKTVYINFRDEAGANSSTSDSIILDTTLPTPSLTINEGASSTNNATVTLSITASGATYMKIDNDTNFANMTNWIPKANTYTFTIPNTEGVHTVYLKVKDDAGNTKITSDSITLDTTPPSGLSISINNGAAYTNNRTVTLTLSATGGPAYNWLSNDGSTWTKYQYSTTQTWTLPEGEGLKTVYYKASDSSGNNATAVTATITLDTIPPSPVTLSSPSSGATVSTQTPTFSWSDPNSNTKQFKIEILQSGSVVQSSYLNSSTTTYTAETLAEGSYSWRVTVYDMANNSATTSQRSFTVSVTGLATPSPTFPTNGAYVNDTTPRIQWSQVSGAGITYEYRYGNSATNLTNSGSTSNLYVELSNNYTHGDTIYWQVRSRNATTQSNYSTIRSFTIDIQPPILHSIQINNDASYTTSRSVTLTLNATGANWMKLSENEDFIDTNWIAYATTYTFTLSSGDGEKTIYFIAKDNAVENANVNNTALTASITLDTQAPYTSNPVPNDGASITTTNPTIQLTYGDNGTGIKSVYILVDNVNVTSNATISDTKVSYTLSSASTGTHTVNVTIHDNATHTTYYNWSFTISTSSGDNNIGGDSGSGALPPAEETDNPPIISDILQTPQTITNEDTITIKATVTDDNEIESVDLYWNDGTLHSKQMTLEEESTYYATIGPFTSGTTVTYYITATDNAPQTNTSDTYSFTVLNQSTSSPTTPSEEEKPAAINLTIYMITAGETKNISLKEYETVLEEIKITAANNLTDVKVNVKKLTDKPADVMEPSEKVYTYISIETNVESDDISSIIITFKVEKPWFKENNIDKKTVVLLRYYSNQWQKLTTTFKSEDEEYVYYEAETTGLSTFAIVGSTLTTKPSTSVPTQQIPWILIVIVTIVSIIAVIVLLFKTGFLYLERKEPPKNKK